MINKYKYSVVEIYIRRRPCEECACNPSRFGPGLSSFVSTKCRLLEHSIPSSSSVFFICVDSQVILSSTSCPRDLFISNPA